MRTSVVQWQRQSASQQAATGWTLGVWVGAIGGSALPTDPDPNVTPPSAGRIFRATANPGRGYIQGGGSIRLMAGVVAASSISVRFYVFDNTQNLWLEQFGTTITPIGGATANATNLTAIQGPGARYFCRITANTLVQLLGYGSF